MRGTRAQRYMEYFGNPQSVFFGGWTWWITIISVRLNAAGRSFWHLQASTSCRSATFYPVIGFVEQKNLPGLASRLCALLAQGQAGALNLVIAGDGPLRDELIV